MFEDHLATSAMNMSSQLIATSSGQATDILSLIQNLSAHYPTVFTLLFFLLQVWVLTWKGLALWRAGRLNQKLWFILVLIINTLGIFDIIYYFYLSKQDWDKIGQKLHLIKKET